MNGKEQCQERVNGQKGKKLEYLTNSIVNK